MYNVIYLGIFKSIAMLSGTVFITYVDLKSGLNLENPITNEFVGHYSSIL